MDIQSEKVQFKPVNSLSELDGRYSDIEPIAHGAQATVFRAISENGERVAIKVFDLKNTEDWKSRELFEREINVLKKLNIKGVPKFIESIKTETFMFLIEEYIDAASLEKSIENEELFSIDDIEKVLMNSAKILAELGAVIPPVIHRDIKPGNLLVDNQRHVYLVDFGVVTTKVLNTSMTFAGTAGYMAPELLYGKASTASDIYSLGATLLHLITRISPCDMPMNGIEPDFSKIIPSNVPEWISQVIQKMMAIDPQKRIQNGRELLEYIDVIKDMDKADHSPLETLNSNADINSDDKLQKSKESNISLSTAMDEAGYLYSVKKQCANFPNIIICMTIFVVFPSFVLCYFLQLMGFSLEGSFVTHWLPIITPLIMLLIAACISGCNMAPTPTCLKENFKGFEKNIIALNAYCKKALLNPECDEAKELGKNKNFLDLKQMYLDKQNNSIDYQPLTESENEELDAYLKDKNNLTPCVAYKAHYDCPLKSIVTSIICFFLLGGCVFFVISMLSEQPLVWNVISLAICALCFIPIFAYYYRIPKYHKKRMENPTFQHMHALYTRRFIEELKPGRMK